MLLNQFRDESNRPRKKPVGSDEIQQIQGFSAGREREVMGGLIVGMAVRTAGAAGLGTGAERLVDDGLDGTRASAAFGAAAEATINLLRITRQFACGDHGIADIVIAEDVTGTNNHRNGMPIGDAELTDIEGRDRMQKEKPHFQAIPN